MSIQNRIERFSKYNISRKIRSIKFDEKKAAFLFKIVPFLLHCNFPDLPGYVDDDCPFGIQRFVPQRVINRELFESYFPESTALRRDTSSPFTKNPVIYSLKTIGSIGTIAQTKKSDCDYWVSIRDAELGNNGRVFLQRKCKAIEKWAADLGDEIYFFLMDIDQTRENSFESRAEDESAGSAIKLLLKDELFRTHIQVAGKMLLWWLIPPGLSEQEYKDYVQELKESAEIDINNFVDLGYISNLPKSEIFGACLWQMNKALDSPFKSIIKFAYLELLLQSKEGNVRLFSDRIKLLVTFPEKLILQEFPEKLVLQEFQQLKGAEVDPYLLLAREIVAFYLGDQSEKGRDEFIRACFFLKTLEGMESQKKEIENGSHIQAVISLMQDWNLLPENVDHYRNFRNWKFKDLQDTGKEIHHYLIETYKRLRRIFKTFDKDTALTITEQDISILGRKLFTFYQSKPNKIEYVRSISREAMWQADITLHVARHEGTDFFFAFQGAFDQVLITEKADFAIIRETDLIRLLVWLMVNGIMNMDTKLHMTKNYLSVDLVDILPLVDQLFKSFPAINFAHISADQLLKNEIIVKALAIINFSRAPVRSSKTLATTIVSVNSYGEYYLHNYTTLTQYKNSLMSLLTKHYVSRWNNNLVIYIPEQKEYHLLSSMVAA